MEEVKNDIESTPEVVKEVYEAIEEPKKVKNDTIEDCFEVLVKEKDKEIRVLNVTGGCILNTYVKGAVTSLFVPQVHIREGKLTTM